MCRCRNGVTSNASISTKVRPRRRTAATASLIDRNFLDVSSAVRPPEGCPTNLDFAAYPLLRWPKRGEEVRAAQCLLAQRGFDPGPAAGILNWRTVAAIRAFKASRALESRSPPSGAWLDRFALSRQHRASSPRVPGPWVRKVQRALTARLETTVTIDGIFGSAPRTPCGFTRACRTRGDGHSWSADMASAAGRALRLNTYVEASWNTVSAQSAMRLRMQTNKCL